MSKRTCQLVETSSAAGGKRIKEVVFGLLSPEEMESLAEFECNNRELYTLPSRKPAPNGCLDLRLGAANKQTACATCHKRVDQRGAGAFSETDDAFCRDSLCPSHRCAGHFGVVRLEQGSTRERNSQLQRLRSRPFSTRFG